MMEIILWIILGIFTSFFILGITKIVESIFIDAGFKDTLFVYFAILFSPIIAFKEFYTQNKDEQNKTNSFKLIVLSFIKAIAIFPFSLTCFIFASIFFLVFVLTLPIKVLIQFIFYKKENRFINKYKIARLQDEKILNFSN